MYSIVVKLVCKLSHCINEPKYSCNSLKKFIDFEIRAFIKVVTISEKGALKTEK